ncbi:MAG: peptidoglycan DD-metalloendopeptidase family protein [Spirochaetes bacterium]|nr:peptidoglycan DD-metalloendopeptidase family protein [Spirochaetota bacterium]
MKFEIRDYKNRLTRRLYEKFFMFKKRSEKFWNRFVEKGHEKMTIMFIPHDEKKIVNFQISKFIIMFFISLFVFIIITSSYAVIKNKAEEDEVKKQLLSYRGIKADLVKYEQLTNEISNIIEVLKPEIESIYQLSSDTEEIGDLWSYNDSDIDGIDILIKNKKIISDDIYSIKKIQTDLTNTTNIIKTVENFINERNRVMNQMPSLIPNPGHITSLFGWRRSPFGHGRDFHTGIDIAASPGTAIHSTAPGCVVFAGWMGGYGKAVKIKHKYGYETIYAHMSGINVGVNTTQTIKAGTVVGFVGMTGNATGNHCHYEIRLGDVAINPYPYMSRMW